MGLPRAIACFTFDNMGEAADVGAGLDVSLERLHSSIAIGYPNLYRVLAKHGVRATFFVEGWNGRHHPDAVAEVVRQGHELGMHGWVHEAWGTLDPATEASLATRATETLEGAAGIRPRGFRAPGGARSAHTEGILKELGYSYDASLGEGMRPMLLPSGIAQVPFVWPCVDGYHYLRAEPARPDAVQDSWLRALERVAEQGGLFLTICHAFITGIDAERLAVLDTVIAAAAADRHVTVCTAGEVASALTAPSS